jgi:HK97 gp10 family phage protein
MEGSVITWNGQQVLDEIGHRIDNQAITLGRDFVRIARTYAPVHTGYLRDSITYDYNPTTHTIQFIVEAPYGVFVEYGTRYAMAHPYVRPAINALGEIWGFETEMFFSHTIQTDTRLLAHGPTYQMHKSLTEKQKQHVRTNLKPVSEGHHGHPVGNVRRAKLTVRHY